VEDATRRRFLGLLAGSAIGGIAWRVLREQPPSPTGDPPSASASTSFASTTTLKLEPAISSATTNSPAATEPRTLEVIERAGWGAAEPTGSYLEHTIERMTVHHTATLLDVNGDAPAHIRGHQRFHQEDRAWADLAYHFIIDLDGNVYEGRPLSAQGDTATSYDTTGHFLPVLEGDYDRQQPSDRQVGALTDLLAWAAERFSIDTSTLAGHRDYASTSCPGDAVYGLIADGTLAAEVANRIAAGGVSLVYLRGLEAIDRVAAIEAGGS
jgi:hypothetical protein